MSSIKCPFCEKKIERYKIEKGEEIIFLSEDEDIFICEDCIKQCSSMLKDFKQKQNTTITQSNKECFIPKTIKQNLDDWIIGQDNAKTILSTALYNHYKRINQYVDNDEDIIEKSNIILVGSTGSGKTSTVKALAKQLELPLTIEDATSFSATGYVGGDVEDILKRLLDMTNGDLELAQKGIVLIDEGDKIRKKGAASSGQKDVNGESVQQRLLKLVEGGIYEIKYKKKTMKFDTTNVLFILGGAFEGIEKIIQKRLDIKNKTSYIGFTGQNKKSENEQLYNELIVQVRHEDLHNYGMTPELLGRFPVLTALQELSEDTLVKILTEPKNALVKQYTNLFKQDNVELRFTKEALYKIAKEAKERKIGARALRSIMEETLKAPMFEVPGSNISLVEIDKNLIANYYTKEDVENKDEELSLS